jgi:hypothetical protein
MENGGLKTPTTTFLCLWEGEINFKWGGYKKSLQVSKQGGSVRLTRQTLAKENLKVSNFRSVKETEKLCSCEAQSCAQKQE